jgi:hypothetical protein
MREPRVGINPSPSSPRGRVLARQLAEEAKGPTGRELNPVVQLVTGEVRRDWSDPEFEGYPEF